MTYPRLCDEVIIVQQFVVTLANDFAGRLVENQQPVERVQHLQLDLVFL